MGLAALFQAVLALASGGTPQPTAVDGLSPRQKAALVVVSGLPAPRGVAGVLVQTWSRNEPRPRRALVFADQEGGSASSFDDLPPSLPAASIGSRGQAFAAGRATGRALGTAGVDVDLAPVLDLADGPLGSRQFSAPAYGIAFARGLAVGGTAACAKHFPGLGAAALSTDESPHVHAGLPPAQLEAFRRAIRAGVSCVMVGHAFYNRFGASRRASFSPAAYLLLRREGFDGVAITDSVSVFGSEWAVRAARRAVLAGADLVLLTNGPDAARVVRALVPLARRGLLDEHVERVLAFRRSRGLPALP
ncbi:MAG TPA: glycoside hydrolase family 3 N-terminal domain-containing protein [Gaiellaceae bacterium]|nr:glycoside hydrolase family 3 N-terminal domain-containing protein [Gaiellaceae bacterium]